MKRTLKSISLLGIVVLLGIGQAVEADQPSPQRERVAQSGSASYEVVQSLGRGSASVGVWSPDGETLAIGGSQGIWLYGNHLQDRGLMVGHPAKIGMITWSPDSQKIASVSRANPNEIIVWNLQTNTQIAILTGHTAHINSIMWNPMDGYLASGSDDTDVRVWNTTTWQSQSLTAHTDSVFKVLWSPDGQKLASSSGDNTIRVWDTTSWQSQTFSAHKETISEIAWSPDNQRIASSSWDGTVRIWNVADGQSTVLSGQQSRLLTVSWNPDGTRIASGGLDSRVFIWDSISHELVAQLPQSGGASQILWYPDGNRLLSVDRAKIIWNVASQQAVYVLDDGSDGMVERLFWRNGYDQFTSIGPGAIIQLWDAETGQILNTLASHTGAITAVEWHNNGRQLGGIYFDGWGRTWQVDNGDLATGFSGNIHPDTGIGTWNSTWTLLAADTFSGGLQIFDWQEIVTNPFGVNFALADPNIGESGFLTDVAWSPDDSRLASITMLPSSGVHIFDTTIWQVVTILEDNRIYHTETLKWNPANGLLAVGGEDSSANRQGIVQIWDITTDTPQQSFQVGATSVVDLAWGPGGNELAIISQDEGIVYLWDTNQETLVDFEVGEAEILVSIAWSSNNLLAIAASEKIHIWNMLPTGPDEIDLLQSEQIGITDIAWSPDGNMLASGDREGIIKIWGEPNSCDVDVAAGDVTGLVAAVNGANSSRQATTICLAAGSTYALVDAGAVGGHRATACQSSPATSPWKATAQPSPALPRPARSGWSGWELVACWHCVM
jgi:WD40 repeat protein